MFTRFTSVTTRLRSPKFSSLFTALSWPSAGIKSLFTEIVHYHSYLFSFCNYCRLEFQFGTKRRIPLMFLLTMTLDVVEVILAITKANSNNGGFGQTIESKNW